MPIIKRIILTLTLCAAAGWFMVTSAPAQAVPHPREETTRPLLACTYQVQNVRSSSFLNVRKGPGLRYRPVGRLKVADGRFAGACGASRGWVALKSSSGHAGWASAGYLHRIVTSHPSVVRRPSLSCTYQVANMRAGGYLNVRKGPGLGYQPVGRLDQADGRIAGACSAWRGWVAVTSSNGKAGWASSRYLQK
jgi:uncharacterized protein YgiM (DUF1202 family)